MTVFFNDSFDTTIYNIHDDYHHAAQTHAQTKSHAVGIKELTRATQNASGRLSTVTGPTQGTESLRSTTQSWSRRLAHWLRDVTKKTIGAFN
eukprot:TRINITY_DN13213_c0_g1_i1.p1 TRINITY_DN13213_c0_g1~~TRINITY_DN13213_c0_g1_i1.p1  ORF type:complete len:101 (+),score=10.39 TRINITY_DN13213_c0_g1_i1:29-304(+)